MKSFFYIKILILILGQGILCFFCGCNFNLNLEEKEKETVSIVNWNVQTFFDSETEGTEYEDFIKNPNWNKDAYSERLSRLCSVMTKLNGDIYIFEEIENEQILKDISNYLYSQTTSKKKWNYTCFAKDSDSSIGIGIFSRYEICSFKTHRMDIRTQNIEQPSSRLMLQTGICIDEKILTVFANHWKSKSGGEWITEIWRDWQENILSDQLSRFSDNDYVIICGDFNRSAEDFICHFNGRNKSPNVMLRGINNYIDVYCPWFTENGDFYSDTGSYYYDKEWERIDNIFGFGNVKISGFNPKAESPWANSTTGAPIKYSVYTGKGYSDHLPVMCCITL